MRRPLPSANNAQRRHWLPLNAEAGSRALRKVRGGGGGTSVHRVIHRSIGAADVNSVELSKACAPDA